MNDPHLQPSPSSESVQSNEPPQFGAVDIVEAFTAMRHECRLQTKESRVLAEQIQLAVTSIRSLETNLIDRLPERPIDEPRSGLNGSGSAAEAKPLVQLIIDIDHQLSRAVSAIEQLEVIEREQNVTNAKILEQSVAGMSGLARWFARPLLTFITEKLTAGNLSRKNPAIEGLNLVLARFKRAMNEQGIERIDTLGAQFDADIMHAIGTVETPDYTAGSVAEQLSPAYRWQGRLLRFAEVRIAQQTSTTSSVTG